VDDFGLNTCRVAITDFRDKHGIPEEIVGIDRFAVY
jgi:hypothetical protein